MKRSRMRRGVLVGSVVMLLAAAAMAQSVPGGSIRQRGAGNRNNPQWQECRKQAEAKNLARTERRTFMQQCLQSGAKGGTGGKTGPTT